MLLQKLLNNQTQPFIIVLFSVVSQLFFLQ